MDVAQSAPQEAHCHAVFMVLGLGLHQLGSRPTFFIPRWITHLDILHQVCDEEDIPAVSSWETVWADTLSCTWR